VANGPKIFQMLLVDVSDFSALCGVAYVLTAKPVFQSLEDQPRNVNVTNGDTVTMSCKAEAEPQARVVWMRNGQRLHGTCIVCYNTFTVKMHVHVGR